MSNFLQASKQKLRFQTTKGLLSVEQLWDLPLTALDTLAVSLEEAYDSSKGKSFIRKTSKKDKTLKLQFNIVLDILNIKMEEQEDAKAASDKKAHNQKILGLIQDKKEEELKGKSVKDLQKMLK